MNVHLASYLTGKTADDLAGSKREFLEIGRKSGHYPLASARRDGVDSEVSVWCSNDYLGMGQNRQVVGGGGGGGQDRKRRNTTTHHTTIEKKRGGEW
ncbi:hypothetical protein ACFWX1_35805, partial [Amycolatopsis sp. NPDC059021]